jgi:predicted MFS family arabinose efflux permease
MTGRALVSEAVGADLPLSQAAAALALGVIGLLLAGVLPALFGALADEHRLSASGIGLAATFEGLSMGLATAAAGIVLPPNRLKLVAGIAVLVLAAADLLTLHARDEAIMVIRTIAGLPEGVLLWIAVGMIARTATPERWAGIFFIAITISQLAMALLFAQWILPAYGADGGFAALGVASVLGVVAAFFVPDRYAALPDSEGQSGSPPPRGWFALFATLVFLAAYATVGVYLEPLAHEAGLGAGVARTAVWISLAAQIGGGIAATAIAGHVRYLTVFVAATVLIVATWAVFLLTPPAWVFIAANAAAGFASILIAPFLVPMTIEADPSRRAAVLSGSTQVLAGALGPFAASFVVGDDDVRGAIVLGTISLFAGLALIAGLHFTARRSNHTV